MMEGPKSCQFQPVHCHFVLLLKCYNSSDLNRKTGPGSGVMSVCLSLDRVAIHLTIDTAPSLGIKQLT